MRLTATPPFGNWTGPSVLESIDQGTGVFVLMNGERLTFATVRRRTLAAARQLGRPDLRPPTRSGTRRAFRAYTRARQALAESKPPKHSRPFVDMGAYIHI